MSKTDKYADKERNSSAWIIVVLITSLKKLLIKNSHFWKRNIRIKQYLKLYKTHRIGEYLTVMQMVANENTKQHKKQSFHKVEKTC